MMYVQAAEDVVSSTGGIAEFVNGIIAGVTSNISLTTVATVVAGVVGAGIAAMFAWKFARKGFAFVKNALSGKGGKI